MIARRSKICKEADIQFGYHNHNNEFSKLATPEQIKAEREEIIEMMKKHFFVKLESDPKGRKQFEGVEKSAQFLASQDYVW